MKRNCNLQLPLTPPTVFNFPGDDNHPLQSMKDLLNGISKQGSNQQLTIMFDRGVFVCDVTELQARAIILHASQETEEKPTSPPLLRTQLCTSPGSSMKKSLQAFLLKRRHRIQATSPYHH